MPSNINGVDGSRPAAPGAGRISRPNRAAADGGSTSAPASSESVHITDTASQLASLEQTIQGLPSVDETRVATLRTAIEQGTYAVSPDNVADNLMQLEHSLGTVGQGE